MTQVVLSFICFLLVKVTISALVPPDQNCASYNAVPTDCKCEAYNCPKNEAYETVCNKNCTPGCKCGFNERFAENGTCISAMQCPPFRCDKRPNEEYVACPPLCPPSDRCSDALAQCWPGLLPVIECFPKCRCKPGFYRKSGYCVPAAEC